MRRVTGRQELGEGFDEEWWELVRVCPMVGCWSMGVAMVTACELGEFGNGESLMKMIILQNGSLIVEYIMPPVE
ncbi:hypothetical protein V6N11_058989 [Hibiscus sabdariffa]|uniref:Uncharacterized protein n=1 Tax=Hibiscus sabdariffa TaxID=183260 RepID=A0ABR2U616_9ROSI